MVPVIGAFIIIFIFQLFANPTDPVEQIAPIQSNAPFYTEKAQKRAITSMVKAQGILVPTGISQIGNLIDGIMRYIYVEENDLVKEGQLLAEVDGSLENYAVNATFGNLDAAQANLSNINSNSLNANSNSMAASKYHSMRINKQNAATKQHLPPLKQLKGSMKLKN